MGNPLAPFDQRGVPESSRATYSCATLNFTPAATATDFSILQCISKVVRLQKVGISGLATAASIVDIQLIYRTTGNTAGTPVAQTINRHDLRDPVAVTGVFNYTANPAGLGSGNPIRASKLFLASTTVAAGGQAPEVIWDFGNRASEQPTLSTAGTLLCLNWGGQAVPAGTVLDFWFEFTEDQI